MTRKSEVALIYSGPLAHRGKAVCYTKETPNLLRDMLNIPLLLGTKKSLSFLLVQVKTVWRPASYFAVGFGGINWREHDGKRELWVGGLAARWKEGLFWSQCGMVSTKLEQLFWWVFGNIAASVTGIVELKPSLQRKFRFFWLWKLFYFKVSSSPLQNDWFLPMSTGIIFYKTIPFFPAVVGRYL